MGTMTAARGRRALLRKDRFGSHHPARTAEPGAHDHRSRSSPKSAPGWHSVPCDERWGHCGSENCFPMGSDNPYWPRCAARMSIISPPLAAGMGALGVVSVRAVSSSKNENWRPLSAALSFGLGDQACADGWHQALWLDWRDEWWWGPCVPNR